MHTVTCIHTHARKHVCTQTHAPLSLPTSNIHSLFLSQLHTHTHILSLSLSLSLSLTHTHTHSYTHTHTHTHSHKHTHTQTHTHTHTQITTYTYTQMALKVVPPIPFAVTFVSAFLHMANSAHGATSVFKSTFHQ